MKILVTEDDFISRKLICKFLQPYGYIDVTTNGVEAIEAFETALSEKEPYDLICMDIMMPGMNGSQALEKIREMEDVNGIAGTNRTKIIMTTGLNDSDTILKSFNMECDGYITKPYSLDKLQELTKLGLIS
jgi:two-component system, chemotaxis family, chemotaxis protein CheY